jgi:ATP-binding cassette subfamily B protein
MVLLIQLLGMMRFPIFNMSFIIEGIQKAIAGSKDYFTVMNMKPSIADKDHAPALDVPEGRVVYSDVTFGYSKNKSVLHNVSFEV